MSVILFALVIQQPDPCQTYIRFIIALGSAIGGMALYIVKREVSREKVLIEAYQGRIADNKEHYDLVETLLRVLDTERTRRKGGPDVRSDRA